MKGVIKIPQKETIIILGALCFILAIVSFFLITGFVGYTTLGGGRIETAPDLRMSDFKCNSGWSLGMGCYYTCSGVVYNAGTAASNVRIQIQFIEDDGTIGPTKTIIIGDLAPGESSKFSTDAFDTSCFKRYGWRYRILYGG